MSKTLFGKEGKSLPFCSCGIMTVWPDSSILLFLPVRPREIVGAPVCKLAKIQPHRGNSFLDLYRFFSLFLQGKRKKAVPSSPQVKRFSRCRLPLPTNTGRMEPFSIKKFPFQMPSSSATFGSFSFMVTFFFAAKETKQHKSNHRLQCR